MKIELEEKKLHSRQEYLDDIAMSLGGYAAEQMVFGDITTGPSNDLQVATSLARAMVTRWGMSELIGPRALENDGGKTLFGGGIESKEYSERMAGVIDGEVERIMKESLQRASKVLTDHRGVLDIVAKKLIDIETLEQPEYEAILTAHGIPLKKIEA